MKFVILVCAGALTLGLATGCSHKFSFGAQSQGESFQQASSAHNSQIDILWVVDNSLSMDPFQQNVARNFDSFIGNFVNKGYNFRMGVTSSDSYLALPQFRNDLSLARLKDGTPARRTNIPVITPSTPDLVNVFITNALIGANGSGDERAFQSMFTTLSSSLNSDFLRPNSFLAIVILSDEDDFSSATRPELSWVNGGEADHNYNSTSLISVDATLAELDRITNSKSESSRRYNVSAITISTDQCLQNHLKETDAAVMGTRYMQLANRTKGIVGDICSPNYGATLDLIQQRIAELSTQFPLKGYPIPETIRVYVNRVLVPQSAANGWTYNSAANAIMFHGNAVPPAGASIQIDFDPAKLINGLPE